ncbi:hypothetical protein EV401DRAFT_1147825 [Pisolithus croceorrhizus]|nr:hypothetical protein EV401DRAFT_1147825 [Pisolithus croceorrhizus]
MKLLRWTSFEEVIGIYIDSSSFTYDHDALQALVDMSSLISSQCKNLELLWISVDGYGGIQPAWPRPMLEPYEAFHQLRFIALNTSYSLTLADNDFQDMVKAWPSLEAFHLLHDRLVNPSVHLTLRVTALLYHCPKLK